MRTVNDVIAKFVRSNLPELPAPPYRPPEVTRARLGLCVPSMARHMTDEGWQLFQALGGSGYHLAGLGLTDDWHLNETDVERILRYVPQPSTIVLQDKREWEGITAGGPRGFDQRERFKNVHLLKPRDDIFKLTVLKDAQHNGPYHRQSADEIGCHAWIVYYHPKIVKALAPYVRERHLVRTYHTVDKEIVPPFTVEGRKNKALLSGAISNAYPLRKRLHQKPLGWWDYRMHPGYHRKGCDTPDYLKALSHYKVAICTSSIYGYALRKIVEATACGCRVITDLPSDDVLPLIDRNLTRVSPDATPAEVGYHVGELVKTYDPDDQDRLALSAREWYDYRAAGKRLADDIEQLRRDYRG